MISSHKNNKSGERKKNRFRNLQQVRITFDEVEVKLAKRLGDGNLRLGIRRAIVLC